MRNTSKVVLALIFGSMAASAGAGSVPSSWFGDAELTVKVGEEVDLPLEANPTTGYTWMVKALPANLILESGEYEQSADCPQGTVACDGTYTYRFIGQKSGKGKLVLIYGHPWDQSSWETKEVEVQVN